MGSNMKENRVNVSCQGNRNTVDPRSVKRRAERLMRLVGKRDCELSILLCDDGVITELNREYRGVNSPTDVLSFAMSEGEDVGQGNAVLGDIVISVETALRQAREGGVSLSTEITSLLVHGLLHLLGYDHSTPEEAEIMFDKSHELEQSILLKKKGF